MKRQLLFLTLALIIGGAMALHDTDKNSEDRGAPTPNHSDVLPSEGVKAHKTISSHYSSDADTSAGQLQMGNKQIVANDGTANKALFGYQQGLGLWGTFVAKPGVDVKTNTDLSQFIFNSSQNVFKIVQSGTATLPNVTTHSTVSVVITHNLGFVPIPLVFYGGASGYIPLPLFGSFGTSGTSLTPDGYYFAGVNSTTLTISCTSAGYTSSGDTFKYYLLQETAN